MLDIANKAGKTGCNNCHAPNHWFAACPYKDAPEAKLKILQKKHSISP